MFGLHKRKRRSSSAPKRTLRLTIKAVVFAFILITIIFTWLRMVGFERYILVTIVLLFAAFAVRDFLFRFKNHMDEIEKNKEWPRKIQELSEQVESVSDSFVLGIVKYIYAFKRNGFIVTELIFSGAILAGSVVAISFPQNWFPKKPGVGRTLRNALVMCAAPNELDITDGSEITADPIPESKTIIVQNTEQNATELSLDNESTENVDSDTVENNTYINNLRQVPLMEADRSPVYSKTRQAELLFQSGSSIVSYRMEMEEAVNIVQGFLKKEHPPCQKETLNNADESIKSKVSYISEWPIHSSNDLDKVLEEQTAIYDGDCEKDIVQARSYNLAQLIANNYYGYGLAYYDRGTNPETALSYILLSIKWRFCMMDFELSSDPDEQIRRHNNIYERIIQAYKDIASLSGLSSEIHMQATFLAEVFLRLK